MPEVRLIDANAFTAQYGDYYAEEGPESGFIGTVGDLIATIPAVNRWIPCSERLPEQGQRVIVQFRYGNSAHTAISTAQRTYSGSWIIDVMRYADKECITIQAWMQLPDAYEPHEKEWNDDT